MFVPKPAPNYRVGIFPPDSEAHALEPKGVPRSRTTAKEKSPVVLDGSSAKASPRGSSKPVLVWAGAHFLRGARHAVVAEFFRRVCLCATDDDASHPLNPQRHLSELLIVSP